MTLIKSISGIRGTIGGFQGDNLTPIDVVKFTSAYARFMSEKHNGKRLTIVVGRDARISGEMVNDLIEGTTRAIARGMELAGQTEEALEKVSGSVVRTEQMIR
ncbi:MAG: phosphoglucosamine mutase, partial [Alistipes sp.]|nr:phosphoglucosamine mutase [Alistipes sp.]